MGSYYATGPLPRPPRVYQEPYDVGPSRSGRPGIDYLKSIGSSFQSLSLGGHSRYDPMQPQANYYKPLPALPTSHIPSRPPIAPPPEYPPQLAAYRQYTPPRIPPRPTTEYTPPRLLFPPSLPLNRPPSGPVITSAKTTPTKKKQRRPKERPKSTGHTIIDLSLSSSESSAEDSDASIPSNITPRSADRRRRAASEQPTRAGLLTPTKPAAMRTRLQSVSPGPSSRPKSDIGAVRCSGFTRTGAPCKRLVKVSAPYLTAIDTNLPGAEFGDIMDEAGLGRYCKDHAGMICQSTGFYSKEKRGLWIDFDELRQQTQTLLRMAMESKLTAKESPGFVYAYELRDLQTPSTCYYKVGRTDNVPRRIGQWTNRCQSHSPTLRDIYPAPSGGSGARVEASLIPGAIQAGTIANANPSLAVKRWERLIHLELAEISSRDREYQFKKLREKCGDCGTCHREIFALAREEGSGAEGSYEVVREVIQRWERFVRHVCGV